MHGPRRFQIFALLAVLFETLLISNPALAWKPTTHVYFGDLAWQDAVDDGMVTIHRVDYETGEILGVVSEYAVDPAVLDALID